MCQLAQYKPMRYAGAGAGAGAPKAVSPEVSVVDTAPVFVGTYSYILKGEYSGSVVRSTVNV
jgi:hypothetical protein